MKASKFGLKTAALTRKIVLMELAAVRRDYADGCFENAIVKCDSIVREARRLKKVIQIEKQEAFAKGRNIRVSLSTTVCGDLIVRVPNGADVQKYVANYIRRKNIHTAGNCFYTNEVAEIRDGEKVVTFYPWASMRR